MEILLWLVPAALVAAVAMAWAGWAGRRVASGDVRRSDPQERAQAVARLGEALARPAAPRGRPAPRPRERSTGVAVRPSRRPRP